MLKHIVDDRGLTFAASINGRAMPFLSWCDTDDCIYFFPLSTLVDNGQAIVDGFVCTVPFASLYLLEAEDRALLGVPFTYTHAMRLRGEGTLNSFEFHYALDFLTHAPDGELILTKRKGNIITQHDEQYLLSPEQYALVQDIDAYNATSTSQRTFDFNLRSFAHIKHLALQAGCALDSYLQGENVLAPQQISITVDCDENGYTVEPAIICDKADSEAFQHTFERMRRVQSVYPIAHSDGSRLRVVLNEDQKNSLVHLKQEGGRHKSLAYVQDLVLHPTKYFDPDSFDLTALYSDRVIALGIYTPRFYPFVSPYKSCWVTGADVETPENGTTRIIINDAADLQELRTAIEKAKTDEKSLVHYAGADMAIVDAEFLADTAERQQRSPNTPVKTVKGREVLIIEENAEELCFQAKQDFVERASSYTLHTNTALAKGFTLKPHQCEGVAWLQYLYKHKASGCLLADDMGLGKTLQVLYFIDALIRTAPKHKPCLIVAPISLLENWENEYYRFFPTSKLRITQLTGASVGRQYNSQRVEAMQQMDIILTNYEALRTAQLSFCAVDFNVVVLDEAQKIKTPGTLITNAAKALKCTFRIAVTGTPVENTLLDLWCIMDFCVPGLLGGARDFAAKYQTPLADNDTDLVCLGAELHEKLSPYFICRMKSDVAKDLPTKIEIKEKEEMPEVQLQAYKDITHLYNSGKQTNMLLTIMDLREVSEHPFMHYASLLEYDAETLIHSSARLTATTRFLDRIQLRGEKVILFADRRITQRMLQRVCHERYGLIPKIINGDTPTGATGNNDTRQQSIDKFQAAKGFQIIIMSPLAAGIGLNVTGANHVIHYSRHWNPAKENQATDRAYRIGQTRDVYVYYPMAVSTQFVSFDVTLDELLRRKNSLSDSTIFPTERIEVRPEEFIKNGLLTDIKT